MISTHSKQILSAYGIPTVTSILANNAEDAVSSANEIGYPVVVKINSETITHKTDVGGVKLNLNSPDQVRDAFTDIQKAVEANFDKSDFQGVTVQPQVDSRDAYELIVGESSWLWCVARSVVFSEVIMSVQYPFNSSQVPLQMTSSDLSCFLAQAVH